MLTRLRSASRLVIDRFRKTLFEGRGGVALLDQAVQSAAAFLTGIMVARSCTPAQFGVYILGLRLLDLAMETQNVTVWSPFTFLSPRMSGDALKRYSGNTLVHQLVWTGIIAILLALFGGFAVIVKHDTGLGPVALMLSVACIPFLIREYARRICFSALEMRTVLILDATVAVLQLGVLWVLFQSRQLTIVRVYAVIGAATLIAAAGWLIHARQRFAPVFAELRSDWLRNWSLGKWFFGGNLTLLAGNQIYPWGLSIFHGTVGTGLLGAGDGIVNLVRAGLMAAQNVLGPITAHAYARGGTQLVRKIVFWTTIFLGSGTALFCLFIFFKGEQLVILIYGHKFAGLGPLISVMSLNMLCMALTIAPSYAMSAMDRPDINFRINLVVLGVGCTLGLFLIRQYGVMGAAIGLVIGNGLATIIRHVVFFRMFGALAANAGVAPVSSSFATSGDIT